MKQKLIFLFAAVLLATGLNAQKAWIDPATIIDVNDTVTIYVDLTKCDAQALVGNPGPLYIWTWMPNDPVAGNGQWGDSNEDMIMTAEGNDIWSKKIVPAEFYGVANAQPFYDNGISLLVKADDGSGSGGVEDKTEDLAIVVAPPFVPQKKVYSFPSPDGLDTLSSTPKDIFTLIYDNSIEDKVSMQNATDLYIYARCTTNTGLEVKPATLGQVRNTPKLQMTNNGDGTFRWMILPEEIFDTVPAGQWIVTMRFQVMKPVFPLTSDDAVDGEFYFHYRCQ